jgi:hypothetical protein
MQGVAYELGNCNGENLLFISTSILDLDCHDNSMPAEKYVDQFPLLVTVFQTSIILPQALLV